MLQSFEGNIKAMQDVKTVEQHIGILQTELQRLQSDMDTKIRKALDYIDLILSDFDITASEKKSLTMVKQYLEGEA